MVRDGDGEWWRVVLRYDFTWLWMIRVSVIWIVVGGGWAGDACGGGG